MKLTLAAMALLLALPVVAQTPTPATPDARTELQAAPPKAAPKAAPAPPPQAPPAAPPQAGPRPPGQPPGPPDGKKKKE